MAAQQQPWEFLFREAVTAHERAEKRQGQEAVTCWQHCIQLYQTALAQMPPGMSSFELEFNLGTACMELADKSLAARECTPASSSSESAAEVESLYLTACMHLGRAHELDACSAAALNNWGASLSKFARRKGREDALQLLQESILKHRSAAALEPLNMEYACNVADTVAELAAFVAGSDSDALYREAYSMWELVLQQLQGAAHITDRCDATVNYGNALAQHAQRLSDEGNRVAAMQGFLAAEQQLAVVVSLRPNAIEARLNLADVIRQAAECGPPSAIQIGYARASELLQSALRLNATHTDTLACLADVLLEWSSLPVPAAEAQQRCSDALAMYERALTAGGDAEVAYNAACACARLGLGDRCAQLLQQILRCDNAREVLDGILKDDDFARMRQHAWWQDFEKELARILPAATHWQQATQLHLRV